MSSPPRRLAVLRSHLRPGVPAGEGDRRDVSAGVSASPCAAGSGSGGGGGGEVAGGRKAEGKGCVFCRIIRGEAPAFKVYEDDVCLCILDSHPLAPGHSLIIPKCHFPSLEATPPPVVAAMCSKVPFLSNAIMKATQCDSFNMVVNNGAAAGQVIFHVSNNTTIVHQYSAYLRNPFPHNSSKIWRQVVAYRELEKAIHRAK
ncbi:adenylylsulfatase HINT3 isoform X3 [Oryza brachyantha]|uniref:adenylylsulfatase HINT3 isoform X3 n=1 Tax=Oryza brachyantha TaxID=4533 RepID=UPI001ADAA1F7|nr:adenylylsulfatase HINT3 isoform X3 [Oryza brachyantha]